MVGICWLVAAAVAVVAAVVPVTAAGSTCSWPCWTTGPRRTGCACWPTRPGSDHRKSGWMVVVGGKGVGSGLVGWSEFERPKAMLDGRYDTDC